MKRVYSAGGVVYRRRGGMLEILVAQHSYHKGWVFPKGIIGDTKEDETQEDTALREVKEETGIDAEIITLLSPVTYWFRMRGEKYKKTVHFFVMRHVGGDMRERDEEMQDVEWIPANKVQQRLTYPSDRDIFKEALPIIVKESGVDVGGVA